MIIFDRKNKQAAEARQAAKSDASAAGWQWHDATPAPTQEICEAVMRQHRHDSVWPIGMSEVVDGSVSGHTFTGGHLVGYAHRTTNDGGAFGDRVAANVVWISLPATLPELRMADRSVERDDGVRLPPIASPGGLTTRWSVEGFVPAFAAELLTPDFVATLETAPESCTVVIRAGVMLCYGDPVGDVGSITQRARLLAALIDHVPPACWGRANALIAGTGVSPVAARDGAALVLAQRLVRRDWKGEGLAKVGWEQAPDAKWMVTLSHKEASDVWVLPRSTSAAQSSPSVGLTLGDVHLGSADTALGIPTVASTLEGDESPLS